MSNHFISAAEIQSMPADFETEQKKVATVREIKVLALVKYFAAGVYFGIILIKSEVINWLRIQEMFRFQSFHMYGVLGSAVITGMLSVFALKKFGAKTFSGDAISFENKKFHKGQIFGGLLFGFGWALTGACPGPLYAQIGSGALVVLVTLSSAIAGTWVYGRLQHKLPH